MMSDQQQPNTKSQRREWLSILKGVFNSLPIPIGRVSWGSTIPQHENRELQSKPPRPKHLASDGRRPDRCSEPMDKIRADALLESLRNADAKRSMSLKRPLGRKHTEYHNTCKSTKMEWCFHDPASQRPAKLLKKLTGSGEDTTADSSTRISCRIGHCNWSDKKPTFNRSMPAMNAFGGKRRHMSSVTEQMLDNSPVGSTDYTGSSRRSVLNKSATRDVSRTGMPNEKFTFRKPPSLFDSISSSEISGDVNGHEDISHYSGQNKQLYTSMVGSNKNVQRNDNAILAALASLPKNPKRMSMGASSLLDMDDQSPNNSGSEAIRNIIREEMDRLHSKIKNGFDCDSSEQAMGPRWTCVSCFSLIDPSLMSCPICKCTRNPSRRPDISTPTTQTLSVVSQENNVGSLSRPSAKPDTKALPPSIPCISQVTAVPTISESLTGVKVDAGLRTSNLGGFESLKRPASKLDDEEPKLATPSRISSNASTSSSLKFSFVPAKVSDPHFTTPQVSKNFTSGSTATTTTSMFTFKKPGTESGDGVTTTIASGIQPQTVLPPKLSFNKSDAPSPVSSSVQLSLTTPVAPTLSLSSQASPQLPLFAKFDMLATGRDLSADPVSITTETTSSNRLPMSFFNKDGNTIPSSVKGVDGDSAAFDKSKSQNSLSTLSFPSKFSFSSVNTSSSSVATLPVSSITPLSSTAVVNSISFGNFKFGTASSSTDAKLTAAFEGVKSSSLLFNNSTSNSFNASSFESKVAASTPAPSFGLTLTPNTTPTVPSFGLSLTPNVTPAVTSLGGSGLPSSNLFGGQLSLDSAAAVKSETPNTISFAPPKPSFNFTSSFNSAASQSTGVSQFPLFGKSTSATSDLSVQPTAFSSAIATPPTVESSATATKPTFQFGLTKKEVSTDSKPQIFQFGQGATNGISQQATNETNAPKLFVFGASTSTSATFPSSFGSPSTSLVKPEKPFPSFGGITDRCGERSTLNATSNLFGNVASVASTAPKVAPAAMPSLFRFSGNTNVSEQSAVNGQSCPFPVFGQSTTSDVTSMPTASALPSFSFTGSASASSGLEASDADSAASQNPFSVINSEIAGRKTKHPRKQLQGRK